MFLLLGLRERNKAKSFADQLTVPSCHPPPDYPDYSITRDRGATLRLEGRGRGTVSDAILGGEHKTLFLTNSL